MYLASDTQSLRVKLGGPHDTSALTWVAEAKILTVSSGSLGGLATMNGETNGTTAVTIMDPPLGSQNLAVTRISVYNSDAIEQTVFVEFHDGTNARIVHRATLESGERLEYDRGVWNLFSILGVPVNGQGLPGDDGEPGNDGALSVAEAELDLGGTPVWEKTVVVTDAVVTTSSRIIAVQSGEAATGREADENAMDFLLLNCLPGDGEFSVNVRAIPGPVSGYYKINYQVS
jgi:hypothetical protein